MRSKFNWFYAVVAITIIVFAIPAVAVAESNLAGANTLFVDCTNPYSVACTQYLLGVWDGMMTVQNAGGPHVLCPGPAGVNGAELRLIFNKWAKLNPSALSSQRGYVAAASFIAAFPCRKPE